MLSGVAHPGRCGVTHEVMNQRADTRKIRIPATTVRRVSLSEVSQWLPLTVAALGIIAVVAGQLINTWREHRHVHLQAQRDHQTHWRDQRTEVYSSFFAAVQDWQEAASKVTLNDISDPTSSAASALRERCEASRRRARIALARIDLIGSETVFKQAEDVYRILRGWSVDALDGVLPNRSRTSSNQGLFAVDNAVDELREAIRADLTPAAAE